MVIRGCYDEAPGDGCSDSEHEGAKITDCYCRSDLCNDGATLMPIFKITVAAMIVTIMAVTWVNKI